MEEKCRSDSLSGAMFTLSHEGVERTDGEKQSVGKIQVTLWEKDSFQEKKTCYMLKSESRIQL